MSTCAQCGRLTHRPRFCTGACRQKYHNTQAYHRHLAGLPRGAVGRPSGPVDSASATIDKRFNAHLAFLRQLRQLGQPRYTLDPWEQRRLS